MFRRKYRAVCDRMKTALINRGAAEIIKVTPDCIDAVWHEAREGQAIDVAEELTELGWMVSVARTGFNRPHVIELRARFYEIGESVDEQRVMQALTSTSGQFKPK